MHRKIILFVIKFNFVGWSYLNFVVDELEEPKKNLPKGIFISIAATTSIYLLANIAYFAVLSKAEMLSSSAVAIVSFSTISKK